MNPFRTLLAVVSLTLAAVGPALADSATFTVSHSTNMIPMPVVISIGADHTPVMIPPWTPATIKRDLIRDALAAKGYIVSDNGPGGSSLTAEVPRLAAVSMNTGATGEVRDSIAISRPPVGRVSFIGQFEPIDTNGHSAIFTAGIVTDVGELSVQVSAAELNFQTDGPIICQALFQRLAPRAPQYGAQINFAGDRLEVYFDPAYTVTQGGIIFGTSSPSQQGAAAELEAPQQPVQRTDVNGDGVRDVRDVFHFLALWFASNPIADWDGNGLFTLADFFKYLQDWFAGL